MKKEDPKTVPPPSVTADAKTPRQPGCIAGSGGKRRPATASPAATARDGFCQSRGECQRNARQGQR